MLHRQPKFLPDDAQSHRWWLVVVLLGLIGGPARALPEDPPPERSILHWYEEVVVTRDAASGLAVIPTGAYAWILAPGPTLVEDSRGPVIVVSDPERVTVGKRLSVGGQSATVVTVDPSGQVILDAPLWGRRGERLARIDEALAVYADLGGRDRRDQPLALEDDGVLAFAVEEAEFDVQFRWDDGSIRLRRVDRTAGRKRAASGSTAGAASEGGPTSAAPPTETIGGSPTEADTLGPAGQPQGGGSDYAPEDASFVTRVPEPGLSNETALSDLPTGLVKNENGTGALSIAAQGIDYYAPGGLPVAPADIDSAMTRDAEWDSASKINSATADADFLVLDSTTQLLEGEKRIDLAPSGSLALGKTAGGSSDRILTLLSGSQERAFFDAEGRLFAFDGTSTGLVPHSGTATTWTAGQRFEDETRFHGPGYVDPTTNTNAITLPQGPRIYFEVAELTVGGGNPGTGFTLDTCRANTGAEPDIWDNGFGQFYNAGCGMGRIRDDEWAWGSYWETNWPQEVGDRWFEWNQDFVARDGTVWRPWYFVFDTVARGGEGALKIWALKTRRGGNDVLEIQDDAWPGAQGGTVRVNRPLNEGATGALAAFRTASGPVIPSGGAAVQGKIALRHDTAGPVPSGFDGVLGEAVFDSPAPGTQAGVLAGGRFRVASEGAADGRTVTSLTGVRSQVQVVDSGTGTSVGTARGVDVETSLVPGTQVGVWQGLSIGGLPDVPRETIGYAAGVRVADLKGIGETQADAVRIDAQSGGHGTRGNLVLAGGNATNGHLAFYNGWVHLWAQQGADPPILRVNRKLNVAPVTEADGHSFALVAAPTTTAVVARCGSTVIDPPMLGGGAAGVGTAPVLGLRQGDVCACSPRSAFGDPIIPKSCLGDTDQLRFRLYNASSQAIDPPAQNVDYCCWSK